MSDPERLRPNPYDDEVRVDDDLAAGDPGKTYHFVVNGDPACDVSRQDTQAIASSMVRSPDRPCRECLDEVDPDRECGAIEVTTRRYETIETLVTCPACGRWLVPLGVGHHIAGHSPDDFGLSPLGETVDPDPSQRVATDGGEP